MSATIKWATIEVVLTDMEIIPDHAPGGLFPPSQIGAIRPDRAEVTIKNGEVSGVTIRGDIMTKAGNVSKRHSYKGMAIGHTKLEAEIGATALAQLRAQL